MDERDVSIDAGLRREFQAVLAAHIHEARAEAASPPSPSPEYALTRSPSLSDSFHPVAISFTHKKCIYFLSVVW
jgi:hypothetical protein